MTAFTVERDHDHPVSPAVEQAIRNDLEPLLRDQALQSLQVIPGLDHDGDPVLYVDLQLALVEQGVDPNVLIQSTPAVRRALCGPPVSAAIPTFARSYSISSWKVRILPDLDKLDE